MLFSLEVLRPESLQDHTVSVRFSGLPPVASTQLADDNWCRASQPKTTQIQSLLC